MKPSQLQYFITLADQEHYTKASQLLGITQPTLSKSISNLEDEIGVKLFEKIGRNVVLTDCGKIFLESARSATAIIHDGVYKMKMIESDVKGELSIGHMYLQGNQYLSKFIKGYRTMYEDLLPVFHFDYNLSTGVIEGIKDDTYDVGFCFKEEDINGIEFIPVLIDKMVLVVPKGHPLSKFEAINMADVVEYPFVFYNKKSVLHNVTEDYFRSVKKYPTISGTVKEVSTLLELVKSGMGIGIIPKSIAEGVDEVVTVELLKVSTQRVIYFAYANDKYLSPAVRRFVNYMVGHHRVQLEEI